MLGLLVSLSGCGQAPGRESPAASRSSKAAPASPAAHDGAPSPAPGPATATRSGTRYRVNAAASRITARVEVGGLLAAAGHPHTIAITEFGGEVSLPEGRSGAATLRLAIRSDSLGETGKEFDEKDRRKVNQSVHEEALETGRFPEIVFQGRSESVRGADGEYEATIRGDLTLHGVTRPVSIPVKVRQQDDRLRAAGGFTILHSQYGIKRLSAGAGMVKAKDEIAITFEIQADRI